MKNLLPDSRFFEKLGSTRELRDQMFLPIARRWGLKALLGMTQEAEQLT